MVAMTYGWESESFYGQGLNDVITAGDQDQPAIAGLWVISLVYVASVDRAGVRIGTIRGGRAGKAVSRISLLRPCADAGDQGRRDRSRRTQPRCLRSGRADVFGADSGVGYPAAEALLGSRIARVRLRCCRGRRAAERPLLCRTGSTRGTRRGGKADRCGTEGDRREGPQGRERRDQVEAPNRRRKLKATADQAVSNPLSSFVIERRSAHAALSLDCTFTVPVGSA